MKKKSIAIILICFFVTGCHNETVQEEEVLSIYNEFLANVQELFAYHTYDENVYYNEKYHSKDEIRSLLGQYMTEEGMDQLLNDLYVQENERFVYQEEFQSYLKGNDHEGFSYYEITKKTVFNPGLRMMMGDDLHIYESDGKIRMEAERVPVQFYSEDSMYGQSQFGELGYPSVDYLTLDISFVKEKDQYRIKRVDVTS
ncbi:hypothetical protein N0O92_00095 [Alkalihalobacillus sp. MEB130]|uniref:hypothetical protein n=1 Tax=Alkalihalobacillus sp. MEB130 TaxID=2976704 RepID=UPI0028DF9331|nr:hypothetical protein [Alkalihalobacillus sp. MEB130]MDT8858607.1 hypothetical protein [Alkalihalobacillus sp. MEB130]